MTYNICDERKGITLCLGSNKNEAGKSPIILIYKLVSNKNEAGSPHIILIYMLPHLTPCIAELLDGMNGFTAL